MRKKGQKGREGKYPGKRRKGLPGGSCVREPYIKSLNHLIVLGVKSEQDTLPIQYRGGYKTVWDTQRRTKPVRFHYFKGHREFIRLMPNNPKHREQLRRSV